MVAAPMTHWMMGLLSLALVWAAWCDWRTRHVPFPLLWGLWGFGIISAVLAHHCMVALCAGVAGLFSSLPSLPILWRRSLAAVALALSLAVPDRDSAVSIALISLFWLAFEWNLIGGADAGIAIGLLAWAPTLKFAAVLLTIWVLFSGAAWVARRFLGRQAPLVVALATAGLIYGWGVFFFAG